jgi:AAA domain-containing protein
MPLRGVKPSKIEKRLKVLFYGKTSVGKTTAAIQFPKPYYIDTEGGAEQDKYVEALEKSEALLFQSNDYDDIMTELRCLQREKHEYKTVIIDPLTHIYEDLLAKASVKGTDFGKHYVEANRKMKIMLSLLIKLDVNVIIITHAKDQYSSDLSIIGQTFDCYKKLDYLFDLVLEVQLRGKERVAVVKKSRIEKFILGETIPFSFEEIADRYGKKILEKEAVCEDLADDNDVFYVKSMIDLFNETDENVNRWLAKAKVDSFEEMPKDKIKKVIQYLEEKSKPKSLKQELNHLTHKIPQGL